MSHRRRHYLVGTTGRLKIPMTEYLLYCFDGPRLVKCDTFLAPDDDAAVEGAEACRDGRAAELWSGSRKIMTFNAEASGDR